MSVIALAASAGIGAMCAVILAAYGLVEYVAWREWRTVRDHQRMRRTLREER